MTTEGFVFISLLVSTQKAALAALAKSLENFVYRHDISVDEANGIEGMIVDNFNDNQILSEFAYTLAQYHPSGKESLLSFEEIKFELLEALKEVWNLTKFI